MAGKIGRKPNLLRIILEKMARNDYLTSDLVFGLRAWGDGLKSGEFGVGKRGDESIQRTATLMEGLGDQRQLAESWMRKDNTIDPESEKGLRARLSDEMALCWGAGGVVLDSGKVTRNLSKVVEQVVYELKPELKDEVQRELRKQIEGQKPTMIEGTPAGVA